MEEEKNLNSRVLDQCAYDVRPRMMINHILSMLFWHLALFSVAGRIDIGKEYKTWIYRIRIWTKVTHSLKFNQHYPPSINYYDQYFTPTSHKLSYLLIL